MRTSKISNLFSQKFKKTLLALGCVYILLSIFLVAFCLYFGFRDSQSEAQGILRTYQNNFVSIFILGEEQALDVAIDRMNESAGNVQFRRDDGAALSFLEYLAPVQTAGRIHGTLVYHVDPISVFTAGILGASLAGLSISFLVVLLAFRKTQSEIGKQVLEPIEKLAKEIQVAKSDDAGMPRLSAQDSGISEIDTLKRALDDYGRKLFESQASLHAARGDQALARMMQMMAHDIRKPFTMLKMAFEVVSEAKNIDEARDLSKMMMPEVRQAMNTANGMIQDVMEFSSRANLQSESVSIRKLLKDALRDCFSTQPEADVQLSFKFGHSCQALIDEKKVARVLSNIVTNAIQAMQGHGALIVSTTDVLDGRMLRLSVTNLGSYIEETDREHLFESFFTKGKKEGTGLGLAICKKIMMAHGGEIWVESGKDAVHPSGFVTFHFTLPMGAVREDALALPNHSSEFGQPFGGSRVAGSNAADAASLDNGPPISPTILKSLHDGLAGMASRKLRISIIDDEAAYREGLKALVAAIPEISDRVEVVSYESCPVGQCPSDLIVMDVDMGAPENGFEATRRMRAEGSNAFICIHSNRILSEDLKRAVDAGADTFLSKPMTLEQMAKVLAQSARRMSKCQTPLVEVTPPRVKELIVVFVDDSITFRTLWKHSWKMGHLETFGRPEDCIEAIRSGTLKPDLVVTDFHFGRVSPMTGLDLARTLQGLTDAPVVLASDGMFEKEEFAGEFRGFIAKAVPTLEQLRTLLPAEKAMLVPTAG